MRVALALLLAAAKRAKRTSAFIFTALVYSVLLTSSTRMTSAVVLDASMDTLSGLSAAALDPADDSSADSRAADIVAFWSTDSSDELLLRIDLAELEITRCREGDSPEHPDCDAVCDGVDDPLSAYCVETCTPGVVNTGPQTGPTTCEYNGTTYTEGQTFPAGDACNPCQCQEQGTVACTAYACLSDARTSQAAPDRPSRPRPSPARDVRSAF